jgi:hypothetical protein
MTLVMGFLRAILSKDFTVEKIKYSLVRAYFLMNDE